MLNLMVATIAAASLTESPAINAVPKATNSNNGGDFTSLLSGHAESNTGSDTHVPVAKSVKSTTSPAPRAALTPVKANTDKAPAPKDSTSKSAPASPTDQADNQPVATTDTTAAQDDIQSAAELKAKLDDTLKKISQLLSGIQQAVVAPAAVPSTQPATSAVDAALTYVTPDTSGTATPSAASLLQQLQQLQAALQQLQQASAPATATSFTAAIADATPSDAPDNITNATDPATLLSAVQAQLAQLVQPLSAGQAAAQPVVNSAKNLPVNDTAPSAGVASASLSALSSQLETLKQSLTQTQTQLQTSKTPNIPAPLPSATTAAATPVSDPFQTLKDALASKGLTMQATPTATAAIHAGADDGELPVSYTKPTISLQNVQTALAVAATTDGDTANNNTGSNTGDNSQNQNAQAAIANVAQPQTQATHTATASNFAQALDKAAPAPVAEQVAFQIKAAQANGDSSIRIRLDPADLGKLDIRLNVTADGKTSVTIIADNKDTLNMLQRDTQGLTKALSDAGLSTSSNNLNFSLGSGQQQAQQGNPQALTTYRNAQPEEEEEPLTVVTVRQTGTNYATNGLDISI